MTESATDPQDISVVDAPDFQSWRDLVSRSFVPLKVTSDSPENFRGRMRSRTMDDVSIVEITAQRHTVLRTPKLIRDTDRRYMKLSLLLEGSGLLIQDGRDAALQPGDISIYDTGRPYSLAFDASFQSLVLMFPVSLMDLPQRPVGELTAVRMPGDQGLGRVISPFLVEIARNMDQLSGASGMRLAYNAVDLVTTMFSAELKTSRTRKRDPQADLMARVHNYIDANLGNPNLSPATVAAAHFISTRYLHSLFRVEQETAAQRIRSRRLERCRRDLHDPVNAHRTINAIGTKWGFPDAAHFSRIFRSTFGESPSSFRLGDS